MIFHKGAKATEGRNTVSSINSAGKTVYANAK
jgi:hypothetical protein